MFYFVCFDFLSKYLVASSKTGGILKVQPPNWNILQPLALIQIFSPNKVCFSSTFAALRHNNDLCVVKP